jgi:hypothetical protein
VALYLYKAPKGRAHEGSALCLCGRTCKKRLAVPLDDSAVQYSPGTAKQAVAATAGGASAADAASDRHVHGMQAVLLRPPF